MNLNQIYVKRMRRGFTLLELMLAIAVATILITMGVPALQQMIMNNRLRSQANTLISALNFTRSEAIKRGATVYMSKCTSNGGTIPPSCGTTWSWSNGWIIFVDLNGDNKVNVDTDPAKNEVLRNYGSTPNSDYSLNANNNFTNYISYLPSGKSNTVGRFVICYNNQTDPLLNSKAVFINPAGRARVAPDNNKNSVPEDMEGKDITSCTP